LSNKLPWFPHVNDAHEDLWIRGLIREHGHIGGWLWWVILELLNKHGVGDVLKIDIKDLARAALTSTPVVTKVLTQMGLSNVLRWNRVNTMLEVEIKNRRKIYDNLKFKTLPKDLQNTQRVRVRVRDRVPNIPPTPLKGDIAFESFWSIYPKRKAKTQARKAWYKLKLDPGASSLVLEALKKHVATPEWVADDGKYIPYPSTWLNQRRWEDELKPSQNSIGGKYAKITKH